MLRSSRRGQSVTEYAIVFSVVAAAIIGMQLFLKRGIQAKEKDATSLLSRVTGDSTGGIAGPMGVTQQYEPYYANSSYSVGQTKSGTENVGAGYTVAKTGISETTTRTGSSTQGVDTTQDNGWTGAE